MKKAKMNEANSRKKKTDPLFELEGNQKLNKIKKLQFKKEKKDKAKRGEHLSKTIFYPKKIDFYYRQFKFYRKVNYSFGGSTQRDKSLDLR